MDEGVPTGRAAASGSVVAITRPFHLPRFTEQQSDHTLGDRWFEVRAGLGHPDAMWPADVCVDEASIVAVREPNRLTWLSSAKLLSVWIVVMPWSFR